MAIVCTFSSRECFEIVDGQDGGLLRFRLAIDQLAMAWHTRVVCSFLKETFM